MPMHPNYNTPPPYMAVLAEIEARYGTAVRADFDRVYKNAAARYTRASRLKQFARWVQKPDRLRPERLAYMEKCLADPQAYIAGEINPPPGNFGGHGRSGFRSGGIGEEHAE